MSNREDFSAYRHPKHNEAAALLRAGVNVRDVAKQIGMARTAVQRVRLIEGITFSDRTVPLAEKLASGTAPWSDPQGEPTDHAVWVGKRNHGTPVIRHKGRELSASAVAYEARTGRKPVGMVKSECHTEDRGGPEQCMNPAHLLDQDDRQKQRRQLRNLFGYGPVSDFCEKGHDQLVYGGVEPDLKTYCRKCNSERRERSRKG